MGQTLTSFFNLFAEASSRPGLHTGDPKWPDRQFPALVERGPLRLWHPEMSISGIGTRILLGVATWSGYDMRLLDVVANSQRRNPQEGLIVEVFNVAECHGASDFRRYIPKLQRVFQTPVVGVWRNGQFQIARHGRDAREFVALQFGSSSHEITQYVQDWIDARSPLLS